MHTAADPDLRAAGHTLPQVGRLPLFNVVSTSVVWLAAAEVGWLGGFDFRFSESGASAAAAQAQWQAGWPPGRRPPKASGPPTESAASESLWWSPRGIRVAVVWYSRKKTTWFENDGRAERPGLKGLAVFGSQLHLSTSH